MKTYKTTPFRLTEINLQKSFAGRSWYHTCSRAPFRNSFHKPHASRYECSEDTKVDLRRQDRYIRPQYNITCQQAAAIQPQLLSLHIQPTSPDGESLSYPTRIVSNTNLPSHRTNPPKSTSPPPTPNPASTPFPSVSFRALRKQGRER